MTGVPSFRTDVETESTVLGLGSTPDGLDVPEWNERRVGEDHL